MKQVYETLKACADGVQWRLDDPEPVVLMTEFADSSVNFEVSVWVDDPWRERTLASRLRMAVWDALAEAGIVIAFPQMDVHFDANVLPPRPGQGALAPDDQAS